MKDKDPWSPYEPTAADPWDVKKVAHLHRRAGFGATRAELLRDLKDGPAASVDRLLRPEEPDPAEQEILAALREGVLDSRDAERLKARWLYRILFCPDPLGEKLTLFWHGHFATSQQKVQSVGLMLRQNELFRWHARGEVAPLLEAVANDPAMLVWLDGVESKKEKPNENFAREFLELFTLGIGHYTEADVRQAARAFTGWTRNGEEFHFDPAGFDGGVKTFLGQKGAWKPADIVRITLAQPAAAEFLCRKLYRFFVSEAAEPGAELVRPLAEEMRRSRYSVGHVVGIMLRSRHFFEEAVRRQRIQSPVEFSAGLLRVLEVPRANVSLLALGVACERQGQKLFHPPNVKGWDGGKTWLNSTALLERTNWAADVIWGNVDLGLKPYEPQVWMDRYRVPADHAADAFDELLLQGDGDQETHELIRRAGRDGKPDGLRKAIQLALNCPEYQLG